VVKPPIYQCLKVKIKKNENKVAQKSLSSREISGFVLGVYNIIEKNRIFLKKTFKNIPFF
jgi:hypothetical protein